MTERNKVFIIVEWQLKIKQISEIHALISNGTYFLVSPVTLTLLKNHPSTCKKDIRITRKMKIFCIPSCKKHIDILIDGTQFIKYLIWHINNKFQWDEIVGKTRINTSLTPGILLQIIVAKHSKVVWHKQWISDNNSSKILRKKLSIIYVSGSYVYFFC